MNKKITIITGAGQGIGKYIAKNLSDDFDLIIISKSHNCKKVSEEIKKKNKKNYRKVSFKILNFEKKLDLNKKFLNLKFSQYQKVNLILCAGVVDYSRTSYLDINDWKKIFKINLFSNISFINFFKKKLRNKLKKIIVFSGGGAAGPFKEFPIYSASKTALIRAIENISLDKKSKTDVFAIAPGAVKTKMLKKVLTRAKVKKRSSMDDVFKFINYCLNNDTKIFNGKLINIRDNIFKIKKNNNDNYLKLRRSE